MGGNYCISRDPPLRSRVGVGERRITDGKRREGDTAKRMQQEGNAHIERGLVTRGYQES